MTITTVSHLSSTGYMTIIATSHLSPQVIWSPSKFHIYHHRLYDHHQCRIYQHRLYDHHHSFISITTGYMSITTVSYLLPRVICQSPQCHIYHHSHKAITTLSYRSPQVIYSVIYITIGCITNTTVPRPSPLS